MQWAMSCKHCEKFYIKFSEAFPAPLLKPSEALSTPLRETDMNGSMYGQREVQKFPRVTQDKIPLGVAAQ